VKGSFLIIAKEENVITQKGVRAFIMERLLNSPFSRGAVLNIDKKTVEVKLEGEEKQITAFILDLENALAAEFGNPTVSFSAFQENAILELPPLVHSSQSLVVGQLEKGIGVQLEILDTLKSLKESSKNLEKSSNNLENSFKGLEGAFNPPEFCVV